MSNNDSLIKRVIDDIKAAISEQVADDVISVYDMSEFITSDESDPLLRSSEGFIGVAYAGMVSNNSAQGGVGTVGRFSIMIAFNSDGVRVNGLEESVDMVTFLSLVRKSLSKRRAPNTQMYRFVSEVPADFAVKGDGYAQQWTVPLTVDA